jgi:RHS repeat-associated protein
MFLLFFRGLALLGGLLLSLVLGPCLNAGEVPGKAIEIRGFRDEVRVVGGRLASAEQVSRLEDLSTKYRSMARAGANPSPGMLRQQMAELEVYLKENPDSPYNPDIRRQLGRFYRSSGRYALALERWREGFEACQGFTEGFGKEVADECVAERAKVLASLGRVDELEELKEQMRGRKLDGGFRTMQFREAMESLAMMRRHPEISFRCGPYALFEVGRVLRGESFYSLLGLDSPVGGFSAAALVREAQGVGLGLRAAWRESGVGVVVPSVVHWGDDHYAALTALDGDRVQVVDPTFLMRTWLEVEEVAQEASGVFLVPAGNLPAGWRWLTDAEARTVFGKGFPTLSNTGNAGGGGGGVGCTEDEGDGGESSPCCEPGGPAGGGPGTRGTGFPGTGFDAGTTTQPCLGCDSSAVGMPTWSVDEPWLNLWIQDRPFTYKPKYGPAVRLEVMYKSRQASFVSGYSRLGQMTDPMWKCPWFSRMGQSPWDTSQVALMGTDGRELTYWISDTQNGNAYPIGTSETEGWLGKPVPVKVDILYSSGTAIGYEALRPTGWREQYTNAVTEGGVTFALSAVISPKGETTRFVMTWTVVTNAYGVPENRYHRLQKVIAADGAETTLYYDNGSYPQTVTRVVGPNGETTTFTYNDNQGQGNLATIQDVAGIVSRIDYDITDLPSALVTPYGTTSFSIEDNTGYDGHTYTNQIDRSIIVTEPGSARQIFALINIDNNGNVPSSPPTVPSVSSGEPGWLGTLDTTLANQRNTFYWGRAASTYINTALSSLSATQFRYARIRHWSSWGDDGTTSGFVGNVLQWERQGSPDGVNTGPATWYDYAGKVSGKNNFAGTNLLPSVVAWVMPDATSVYRATTWNQVQNPTQVIERWRESGSTLYRTNSYSYDSSGEDLLTHYGPGGVFQAGYAYDTNHRMIRMTNAVNSELTQYTYDSQGRLTSLLSPSGNLMSNVFSADGLTRTTRWWDAGVAYRTNVRSRSLGVTYTRAGLNSNTLTNRTTWVVETTPYGLSVTNIYDALGRLWERRTPDRAEWFHYELFPSQSYSSSTGGKLILDRTAVVNVIGGTNYNSTTYTYDGLRRLAYRGDPNGTLTEFQYCDCGGLSQVTQGYGLSLAETTSYSRDLLGRVLKETRADGSSVTNVYDALGRLTTTSDALGSRSQSHDNLSRRKSTSSSFGTTGSWIYDAFDQVISSTDRNGVVTTNRYDAAGRMVSRVLVGGGTESWGYTTAVEGATSYTNAINQVTRYAYHAAGWKTNEVIVGLMTNRFLYDGAGKMVGLWDGNQSVATSGSATNGTRWIYDGQGRLRHKVYANAVTNLTYSYDALDRLTNRWSQAMGNTEYRYDVSGNVTVVNYPSGTTDVTQAYDALNRLTNRVDAIGTTGYSYVQGRLRSEDGPWASDTVSWSYNSAGKRSQMVILQPTGNAWTNTYGWDALHRLTQVSSPAGSFSYLFAGAGDRIRNLSQPGGFWVTNTYDSLARLTDTSLRDAGNGLLNRHGYVLNAAHQRTTLSRTNSAATLWNGYGVYTYDAAGEIRTARAYDGSGTAVTAENFDYGYDSGWNILKRTNNAAVTSYAINVLNQVSNDGGSSWVHDTNGNLTYRPTGGSTDLSYAYDAENQLQSVTATNDWKIEFTHDGQGRLRIRKDYTWYSSGNTWLLGSETRYLYDGMLLVQDRSNANNPLVTYTRGADLSGSLDGAGGIGGLLSRGAHATTSPYGVSTSAHYHADGNGNVTMLVGSGSPSVKAYYKYDPFGQTLASGGSLVSANSMRFSSKPVMGSSGLYYYGYRFYDPSSQRWPNRDPLGEEGGLNLYAYVDNDPIDWIDPFGLQGADSVSSSVGRSGGVAEEYLKELALDQARRRIACQRAKQCLDDVAKKVKDIKKALDKKHLNAAKKELDGKVVARKADGTPFDHVTEVRNAQQGIANQIQKLEDSLANCPAGSSEKAALEKSISELSKFLDNTTGWVPKP